MVRLAVWERRLTAEFRSAALARLADNDENVRAAAAQALAGAVGEAEVRDALLAPARRQ